MAIALVDSVLATPGQNGGSTSAIDTTGANLLVVAVAEYAPGTHVSVSDSKGNTWTELTTQTVAGGIDSQTTLFYAANPTVGSGHTFTASGADSYSVVMALAFSGAATTSPFDQENGSSNGTPGSVTPTEDNEVVVTAVSGATGFGSTSIDGSFTIAESADFGSGVNMGGAVAYLIQTTAAAANPTWSASGFVGASVIATFKAAAGGGGNAYSYWAWNTFGNPLHHGA